MITEVIGGLASVQAKANCAAFYHVPLPAVEVFVQLRSFLHAVLFVGSDDLDVPLASREEAVVREDICPLVHHAPMDYKTQHPRRTSCKMAAVQLQYLD